MIYLDNAATTKPFSEVLELSNQIAENYWFNQNSNHGAGLKALELYNSATKIIKEELNLIQDFNFSYSSNASTMLWITVESILKANKNIDKIFYSPIDHLSSKNTAAAYQNDYQVIPLKLNDGLIDLDFLNANVDENSLVLYNVVNSEIGLFQNYQNINEILNAKKAIIIGDVVQAIAKVAIDLNTFDAFIISGHKLNTFKIGLVGFKSKLKISSFKMKEQTLDIGTMNTQNIACLARALKIHHKMENNLLTLWEELESYCQENNYPINSSKSGAPHIFNFSIPGILSENMINYLSNKEIYVSATSACSSKEPSKIGTVQTIFGTERAKNSIRISFSKTTTMDEIAQLIIALKEMERFFKNE